MKIAIVVPRGLHPSGTFEVVPSWLALFELLSKSHDVHAFALKHLEQPQSYPLRGFTVHDLGRPSASFGLTRWTQERTLTGAAWHRASTLAKFDAAMAEILAREPVTAAVARR